MILNITRAKSGGKILIQNSTGAGKSVSVLVGALSRRQQPQKILIFCRTINQIASFLREWKKIVGEHQKNSIEKIRAGNSIKIVPMLGKARMCKMIDLIPDLPSEAAGVLCNLIPCSLYPSRANIKYSRERSLIQNNVKLWVNPSVNTFRDALFSKHSICPYYFQNSLLKNADVVVTTYSYMSEPLFSYLLDLLEINIGQSIIVVDEAHNLVNKEKVTLTIDDIEKLEEMFGRFLLLALLKKRIGNRLRIITPDDVAESYVWEETERALSHRAEQFEPIELSKLATKEAILFKDFLRIRKVGYILIAKDSISTVRVAPDVWLSQFAEAELQVYMSGTLQPLQYYKRLFGFNENTITLDLDNTSDSNQFLCFLKYKGLTSKHSRRGKQLYRNMVTTIIRLFHKSPRHVLVVAPSYSILNNIEKLLSEENEQTFKPEIIRETKKIKISEVQRIANYKRSKILILAVSSGKLTEGVEIVKNGQSMISLVIFAGLPFYTPEPEAKQVFNIVSKLTKDYRGYGGYGIIQLAQGLSQAIGRTVRSGNDKGAMIILDFRAQILQDKSLDMKIKGYTSLPMLESHLDSFFDKYPTVEALVSSDEN